MNIEQFVKMIAEQVKDYLPEEKRQDLSLEAVEVTKMNDQKLHGLSFRRGNDPAPTFYLDKMFHDFESGEVSLSDSLRSLADMYVDLRPMEMRQDKPDLSFERIKDHLAFRLIEVKRNRDFLQNVPYMAAGNGLALICDARMKDQRDGFYSVTVTKDIVKSEGYDVKKLFDQATKNAWKIDEPVMQALEDKLFGLGDRNVLENEIQEKDPLYILTTKSAVHGAAALFYPGVQEKIADTLGENYYALPSSIHEFLILPESKAPNRAELGMMVESANRSVVSPEDILSDNVFRYNKDRGELSIAVNAVNLDHRESKMQEARC